MSDLQTVMWRQQIVLALSIGIGCFAFPVGAVATTNDASATLAYLRADHRFLHETSVHLLASRSAGDRFVRHATAECPAVAAQAPSGEHLREFSLESLWAVALAFERPNKTAAIIFARHVAHLRWSSKHLTRLVRRYAASERAETTLALPHLCSALKEWVAGGYGALPTSTTDFLRKVATFASERPILALLAPHARPGAKTLLKSVTSLKNRVESATLDPGLSDWARLTEGLGMRRSHTTSTGATSRAG